MSNRHNRVMALAASLALAAMTAACGTPGNGKTAYGPSLTDAAFGDSVRQARLRQTIDVDAGSKHGDSVAGDAGSAVRALQQYDRSFEQPRPTINVLGIGGVGGSNN